MGENDFKYKIISVEKTFRIIEVLAKNKNEMSMVDIAKELNIQSSLAYRVLNTLKSIGYVSQNRITKKYFLSYSFLKLTKNIVKRNDIVEKYITPIKTFYNKYGFHSNITGFTRNQVILVKDFSPIHFFSTTVEAGTTAPLHCSAAGKEYLATRTPGRLDE